MEAILDKVKKLLAMQARGTEAEAQVAAMRIAEIMTKYQLDMADLASHHPEDKGPVTEEGCIEEVSDAEGRKSADKHQYWKLILACGIAKACGGHGWQSKDKYGKGYRFKMVGPVGAVSSAAYLYSWLVDEVRSVSRKMARVMDQGAAWKNSFRMGMVERLVVRMTEQRATSIATATTIRRMMHPPY